MTHRIPNRRWQDNPEHKVSKAQLQRVQQAANRSEQPSASPPTEPARDVRQTDHLQDR
jgi:hypothetical protein